LAMLSRKIPVPEAFIIDCKVNHLAFPSNRIARLVSAPMSIKTLPEAETITLPWPDRPCQEIFFGRRTRYPFHILSRRSDQPDGMISLPFRGRFGKPFGQLTSLHPL
jgi:hypothetical protein